MFVGRRALQARSTDNLTAICEPIFVDNVGSLTSHNSTGFHGLLRGQLYFYSKGMI
jgi:hypothetical protein